MKIGDKLYSLTYGEGDTKLKREMKVFTIEEINKDTIKLQNCPWKFKKSSVGILYFLSKKEMYKYSLKRFKRLYKKVSDPLLKEIKYLKKKIR